MGRKKIEKNELRDRIGEKLDLNQCPLCNTHTDCFAWMDGYCTALNECGGEQCPFYKPADQAVAEAKACYASLKARGKEDVIARYSKQLAAIGAMDDELNEAEQAADDLEAFADCDFKQIMEEV